MHEVLQALHEDHVNLSRLLTLVKRELERSARGEDIDYSTMLDVLDYIENYADNVHHMHENAIYDRLKQSHPERAAMVDELSNEHRRLSESTLHASQLLSAALNDVIVDRQKVEESVASYVAEQFEHMGMEEREVFPLIQQTFEAADWQYITEQFQRRDDPLFGAQIENRYRTLYDALSATEE